ncbi:MAG: 1-acyl-sn-glycerol-3-phosphate acyltransferase [Candidatus Dormibacteraeota bacterium]|nr:1-acyl-sn-glycerol-3-phosphate acyltransferase [Candidatus Dormibacteraeota bacterium]
MRVPPRVVRRLLLQPLFVVLTLAATVLSPLLLLGAAAASPFVAGRWRPLRVMAFTIIWMQQEVAGIVGCICLWVGALGRTDTPAMRQQHYRLMRWFLRSARRWGERLLDVTVHIDDDGLAERVLSAHDQPLLVLSRHSGPGDTFYLVDMLLDRYAREPRIVMKDILKLDPVIDLAGSRVPNYFVPPRGQRRDGSWQASIAALSGGMDEGGALLLFPEGGNFTEERRRRRLARLFRRGRGREAAQAAALHHVIAPEPGGALTALAASPNAAVILVAHGGLSGLGAGGGLFRRAPIDQVFRVQLWYIARADIPAGEENQRQWLLDCWQRVDEWVAEDEAVATV